MPCARTPCAASHMAARVHGMRTQAPFEADDANVSHVHSRTPAFSSRCVAFSPISPVVVTVEEEGLLRRVVCFF